MRPTQALSLVRKLARQHNLTVTVTREDNLWVADIAGLTDTNPDDFVLNWRYEVNGRDVTAQFQRFLAVEAELREQIRHEEELRATRDAERVALLRELAEAGLSQRVMGDAVSLSHQRVNQIIHS
jgi:hypothetical protein